MNPDRCVEGALVRIKHDPSVDNLGGQVAKIVHVGLLTTSTISNITDCFKLLLQDGSIRVFHCLEFTPLSALEQLADAAE
jgi:hypothetical protein